MSGTGRFLLGALLIVGCAGAVEPQTTAFRDRAAELCSEANVELERIPVPGDQEVDFETMVPVLEESARVHRRLIVELRELEPPPEHRQEVIGWLDTAAAAVGYLEEGNAAVRAGDVDASLSPYDQADRLGSDVARRAAPLGLEGCFVALSPG